MFENILRFFINNARFNYMLFALIYIVGIYSYMKLPKEIFPVFDLDMVIVTGHYNGVSADTLDKIAVKELEDDLKTIEGVKQIATIVKPGSFSIVVELNKGVDILSSKDKAKDIVAQNLSNLPDDMDEPIVKDATLQKDLLQITIYSDSLSYSNLLEKAKKLKSKIYNIKNISEVEIYGDSDKIFELSLDEKKILANNLNPNDVYRAISTISFTFPLGKIEDKKSFFISSHNGPKNINEFKQTKLNIGGKEISLNDIAKIKEKYEDSKTLFSLDGKNGINLVIRQTKQGNAIVIREQIGKLLSSLESEKVHYLIRNDLSDAIKDRLNIVGSNILLGLILITLIVVLLINYKMAFIIFLGIPTSFVIGAVYFYMAGYTINLISLVGVLLAIGIIVDDAMVVSENIQQYIEKGLSSTEAAIKGTLEMVAPVTVASITTMFAFLPSLMISGTMGEVIKLIPIALSVLIVASLIESFIFLPIHAAHALKKDTKTLSWSIANNIYSSILHFLLKYRKTFLITFLIIVPIISVMLIKQLHFQLFPTFDDKILNISIKANKNNKIEDSLKLARDISNEFLAKKDEFFIKNIGAVAGYRKDVGGNSESLPYSIYITLELEKIKPQNFVDKYITPYLSFYYDKQGRVRELTSHEITLKLKQFIKEYKLKEKYNLISIDVLEKKVGPVKADIKIGLISNNKGKVKKYIDLLMDKISKIDGIINVSNSLKLGIDELKIKVNSYGYKLGIDEGYISSYLANRYLEKKATASIKNDGIYDINILSAYKDNYDEFINTLIPLKNGKLIRLKEICDIEVEKSFEKLIKDNGEINFYVFANVDTNKATANDILDKLNPILNMIKKDGVKIKLKGEAEKNKDLANDMKYAVSVAMVLILLSLLYIFNSFRQTAIIMLIIPYSILGVLIGHLMLGVNLGMTSVIGMLGLAGIVINDGIIMMSYLRKEKDLENIYKSASRRLRPIILTSVTTLIGMATLIFFPSGQAVIFQPMAISLGFGLLWGTVLNLIFVPILYSVVYKIKE